MKHRIIFSGFPKKLKGFGQQHKAEAGACAKAGCKNAALSCERCKKFWKLDTAKRDHEYRYDPQCPFCGHTAIIHNFYCKEHRYVCAECEQDHPTPGCPYRDLRDGKPLRPQHEKWLKKRIEELFHKGREKELFVALFPGPRQSKSRSFRKAMPLSDKQTNRLQRQLDKVRDLRKPGYRKPGYRKRHNEAFWKLLGGKQKVYEGREWQMLQSLVKRERESSADWDASEEPHRIRHSAPAATKAGIERARAAGKPPGRPTKKSK